jgi:hypothetical protein
MICLTYVTDQAWYDTCALPLQKTFHYFHPDQPFDIITGEKVKDVFSDSDNHNIRHVKPFILQEYVEQYQRVVIFDADQLVVGPLTELFMLDWELCGVRSNDDLGISRPLGAFATPKISWQNYLNCGLSGVGSMDAIRLWQQYNKTMTTHMNDAEQGTWNEVFHSGKFNSVLLDPVDGDVIYGAAANYAHWRYMDLVEEKITLNLTGKPKWVKILHRAGVGGIGSPFGKFAADYFKPDVWARIQEILA